MANIYVKGVTVRFGFDGRRISQIQTVSQKQSNGNAPSGVLYMHLCQHEDWGIFLNPMLWQRYIFHRRGAFSVARFD